MNSYKIFLNVSLELDGNLTAVDFSLPSVFTSLFLEAISSSICSKSRRRSSLLDGFYKGKK